jgi:hypothetical protein
MTRLRISPAGFRRKAGDFGALFWDEGLGPRIAALGPALARNL